MHYGNVSVPDVRNVGVGQIWEYLRLPQFIKGYGHKRPNAAPPSSPHQEMWLNLANLITDVN